MTVTRPFHVRLAEVFRWARANDWRPTYPNTRRLGQYSWTNAVHDPGNRKQGTLKVIVDISGDVEVRQLLTTRSGTGWVVIGWFRSGSGSGILDILAAMCVLPAEMSTAYRDGLRCGRKESAR